MPDHRDIVIACEQLCHNFGDNLVLHDVNLHIARGQIVSLVGPSGCGKSTLLRALLGTHPPRGGRVMVYSAGKPDGEEVLTPGPERGIVYQRYALFPFLTARENVAIGLKLVHTSIPFRLFNFMAWRRQRVAYDVEASALLERLGLGAALDLYPSEMSGGMRQRVAIAQALILKPEVLLLDEPFGALDEAMREDLQRMLLTLYLENCEAQKAGHRPPYTILIVTHELNEAIYVADRVLGLSQYWNWKELGFADCPGATIVYDVAAPVYHPDDERDFTMFRKQREEIRAQVFDDEGGDSVKVQRTFWDQVKAGDGKGVLQR